MLDATGIVYGQVVHNSEMVSQMLVEGTARFGGKPSMTDAEIAEGQRLLEEYGQREGTSYEWRRTSLELLRNWAADNAESLLTGYAELQAEIERLETELTTLRGRWESP